MPFATAKAPEGIDPLDAAVPLEVWADDALETDAAEEFDACAPGAGALTQMASPKGLFGSQRVMLPAARAVPIWTVAVGRVAGAGLAMRVCCAWGVRWVSVKTGSVAAVWSLGSVRMAVVAPVMLLSR